MKFVALLQGNPLEQWKHSFPGEALSILHLQLGQIVSQQDHGGSSARDNYLFTQITHPDNVFLSILYKVATTSSIEWLDDDDLRPFFSQNLLLPSF